VTVKFTAAEIAALDAARGNQARGAYLRRLFQTVEPSPPDAARPARSSTEPPLRGAGTTGNQTNGLWNQVAAYETNPDTCPHPTRWRTGVIGSRTCTRCGTTNLL
jgi:hypothetical protein